MLLYAILFTQSTLNSVRPTEPSPIKIIKIFDRDDDDDDGTFFSAYRGHTPTFFLSQQFAKLWPIRETCLLSLSQLKACCTPFSCKKLKTRFFLKINSFLPSRRCLIEIFLATTKIKTFLFLPPWKVKSFEGILFIFVWLKETFRYLSEKEHELIELGDIF